jgi:phosphoesterase RecJ-like protein
MLLEKMKILPDYNSAYMALSRKEMMQYDVHTGDTEGLVNLPLSIGEMQFATLIMERGDEVKFSFRSKGNFDVSSFARDHFNGGGHFNASGGSLKMPLNEAIEYFKKILSDIHPL